MTDLAPAPAGWYPDPSGSGQRWWDGRQWTEYATPLDPPAYAPYGTEVRARVAAGTPVDTVWIWLIVTLPCLALIPLFQFDPSGYMLSSLTDPMAQVRMYFDPMYLTATALSWLLYGAAVGFAYLDVAGLRKLAYTRQFHWACLSPFVYVIGRSVVVKRQAGRGSAPMWVAIALSVAALIGMLAWSGVIVANLMNATLSSYTYM
ncbi:DUF2510 domain-containing protein [Agromyces sp. Soil535]|uniref:DUF2510 domain-containing protein n=1 Tax=Agromyces sp. Soil535 TaxID=1736390 RepID=UPI0006FE0BD1|nr:DUF2510 domain-containing protein [Agromyces sp. Soil535]KRE21754.1 hypothetical protein ASG80_11675 [Agromyces sp. Soil535]